MNDRRLRILLVEDNPVDAHMAKEAFGASEGAQELFLAKDGKEALAFLRREGEFAAAPRPDLLLLDLNLPKKDGRSVLAAIKQDAGLRRIPVVVLTTSQDRKDVFNAYDLHANCFVTKPSDIEQFNRVLKAIECFWLNVVELPAD